MLRMGRVDGLDVATFVAIGRLALRVEEQEEPRRLPFEEVLPSDTERRIRRPSDVADRSGETPPTIRVQTYDARLVVLELNL